MIRRKFISDSLALGSAVLFENQMFSRELSASGSDTPPNILFVSVDDLNDASRIFEGGLHSIEMPAVESLAKRGVTFQRAYTAAPACGPSRTATLSGVHPKNYVDAGWMHYSKYVGNSKLIPELLREKGYKVASCGKVLHGDYDYGSRSNPALYNDVNFTKGLWDHYFVVPSETLPQGYTSSFIHRPFYDGQEDTIPDNQVVANAIQFLNQKHNSPFFLAVGLYRPHLPWLVPKRYFDRHPLQGIRMPQIPTGDMLDLSALAKSISDAKNDHRRIMDSNSWKEAIQGYLASVSFADDCLGKLLAALDASLHKSNTVVVLWSDHGWHLGEKLGWRKFKLWEKALRVPLIITHPKGVAGKSVYAPVSLMDLLPTLTELSGKAGFSQNGRSLVPLLLGNQLTEKRHVVSSWYVGGHNVSSRSERFRYIRYTDGSEELYDHFNDPGEHVNLLKLNRNTANYVSLLEEHRQSIEGPF